MGALVAMKYPTSLFLKAADHTYVQCGTGGKAWSCWGGKTGGTAFNSSIGSTARAEAIANSDERAGITCYLVNGVCHQAANRILLPAGIIVSGARGYAVSSAIFGTYGKTGISFQPCFAPFNQRPDVKGDLPECVTGKLADVKEKNVMADSPPSEALRKHLTAVSQLYAKLEAQRDISQSDDAQFQSRLFESEISYRLGEDTSPKIKAGLIRAKKAVELQHKDLVQMLGNKAMSAVDFIKGFNLMTDKFQDDVASAINEVQYRKMFELNRDEKVILAIPESVAAAYGKETAKAVYGQI